MTLGAVIVENRLNGAFSLAWKSVEKLGIPMVHFDNPDIKSLEDYNKLLTTPDFWENIAFDKILIFQSDCRVLRTNIQDFIQYDYVGAPWDFQQDGGNGGLSLRTKSVMLDVIKNHPRAKGMNEDIYFSKYIPEHGKLAPRDVCMRFSVETVYYPTPFGIHAPWKWLPVEQVKKLMVS